jgi:hypothetical protein
MRFRRKPTTSASFEPTILSKSRRGSWGRRQGDLFGRMEPRVPDNLGLPARSLTP